MKKNILKITMFATPLMMFLFFGVFSHFVLAQTNIDCEDGQENGATQICFRNPLGGNGTGGVTNLEGFVKKVLDVVMTIGVPVVALAIIYCGFLFVMAQGKKEKLKEARDALVYTLIGAAILLGAWVLAQAVSGTIKEIAGVS